MLAIDGFKKLEWIEKPSFIGRMIVIFMMLLMSIVAIISDRIMNKEKYKA